MKSIKKGERLKFFTFLFTAVPFFIALFSALAGIIPMGPKKVMFSFTSMYIALGMNITVWLFGLLYRLSDKRTLWSWICLYVFSSLMIPAIFGSIPINFVRSGVTTLWVIISLWIMYVLVAALPFINEKLSETLHTEIFAPRSRVGKLIQVSVLALAPIAGIFGAFLSGATERSGGVMGLVVMGFVFHFFFVWGEVSLVHQAWEHRPWKKSDEN